jgi:hypothetical protein
VEASAAAAAAAGKHNPQDRETRRLGDTGSEDQYSLAILVSRHLGSLSERNERAREKAYSSRKDAENAKKSLSASPCLPLFPLATPYLAWSVRSRF